MRIALTHNLQRSSSEEEAEFDRPETIEALTHGLERLGHEVEPVEVSGRVSLLVERLENLAPDLAFNTAEGTRGRFREAFYPAIFDQLGIACTGSDAWVCALTLDKFLTKLMVERAGVPTPRSRFVDRKNGNGNGNSHGFDAGDLRFPVIVKPNYEGSSKGITQDSVVELPEELGPKLDAALVRYPAGVLVEEFIQGRDVTVPFLERIGVLPAAEYDFDEGLAGARRHRIYDYDLKQHKSHAVSVRVPAALDESLAAQIREATVKSIRVLGIRDFGRVDYRVTPDGRFYFLEANAIPSLEPGASLYASCALAGLGSVEEVLDAIVKSAQDRHGIAGAKPPKKKKTPLKVGLTYNLKRKQPRPGGQEDSEAEFDSPKTVEAIREAIVSMGHEVIELEATPELARRLASTPVDLVFNLAEGIRGKSRESQVPALLELLDIEYTGSDPGTMSLALDKALAKRIARQAGVATPDFVLMQNGRERLPKDFRMPAIVKPVAEGSSKGVVPTSVVESEQELRTVVEEVVGKYRQEALVESYLSGREFTIALLGQRPKVLPPMEIVFKNPETKHPVYSFDFKLDWAKEVEYVVPAKVTPELQAELVRVARKVYSALGCRDVARIDLRLDQNGVVNFIECNPLPGMAPGWSDLCLIAAAAGMDYRALVGEILAPAVRRLRQKRRAAAASGTMPPPPPPEPNIPIVEAPQDG